LVEEIVAYFQALSVIIQLEPRTTIKNVIKFGGFLKWNLIIPEWEPA
jgi:hypothetical protein